MTKQITTVSSIDVHWWHDLTLPDLLEAVQEAINKHGPLTKFRVSAGYDGDFPDIELDIRREENDDEYAARLEREKKQREYLDSCGRALYARLKAKFGNE